MGEGERKDRTGISVHFCCSEQTSKPHSTVDADRTVTAPDTIPKEELSPFERAKRELLKDPYFCSWSEKQVSSFLLKRLDDLSRHYQIPYQSSEVSFKREFWGLCSSNRHIIINFNVAILPEHLRDYVFLHELIHTRVMSHEDNFWQELDKYTDGKARELQKELHRYDMKVTL